ncbi:SusC/RagA family TonB-linked outer membrane protein [Cesiribacter andamanensis]|uniref:Outer membrane cobalamin receptor protein n=1 Tax=Cesiribacter andamanensis AMV16 TaxID=1279009 RepID=M7P280_9BACT|nr:TonB-dependent receptor [Cesiribacter andamanensis]EMR04674.1 Outer membrane cobalamin receptor protein [Cesiribacter andamanensis AMV16]
MHVRLLILLCLSCLPWVSIAQQNVVKGTVIDSQSKEPLPGVSILVKGTARGVVTDIDGAYRLEAAPSDVLVFSFVGYLQQEIEVGNQSTINISLAEDLDLLEEVVVTGYQSEKKADITGAVSVVKMKDIANIPTGNVMSTLQGRLPGVTVTTDGTPGGVNTGVGIRGVTTINNGTPLYVVDGVQTRANIATLLNANDIESIQVLKDAGSASIYGTQAANGVIIITTKKATKGEVKVDFSSQHTAQFYHTNIDMLDARQWGEVYWSAYQNDGQTPSHDQYGSRPFPLIPEYIDANQTIPAGNTNWADEVYETALLQDYNVTVSKGTDRGSSLFSLNYFDQDGLIKHTNFSRFTARLNTDYNFLNNRLRVGENINVSRWTEILKPGGIEELTIAQHPLIPVYDINGGYAGPTQGLGDKPNPIRLLDQQKDNRNTSWRIFGNAFVEATPVKNLVFRSNLGLNYSTGFHSNFEPRWREGNRTVDKNALVVTTGNAMSWIWTNTANYAIELDNHSINALAGIEAKEETEEWLSARREGFLIQELDYRYLDAGSGTQTNGNAAWRVAMLSHFGKVNYAFMSRYLLSGTLRRDASSRFGANNNSAIFPAITAGWRISEEAFMQDLPFITELKLRGSWGKNGNDLLDNEATYTKYLIQLNKAGYDISGANGGVIPVGIIKERTGNPDIRWEETTQTNFGVDLSMFNNRLNLNLDYFMKNTEDMLIDRPYIAIIGEGGYMAYNGASMKNNGFEAIVNWRSQIARDLNVDITFTGSVYKNEITDLPEDIYYTWGGGNGIDQSVVGQPFGSWMGYRTDGLFRTEAELENGIEQPGKGLGRIRYVDLNGDNVIDDKDRTWLGSEQPRFTGGLNLGLTYKAFDLSLFFNGMVRDAWNNSKFYTDFFQLWTGNHSTRLLDAWNPDENFNSDIPALTAENSNDEGRGSDYFIENGSYMKLKNFVVGYTLPTNLAQTLKMRNMRVFVQGQNLLTFTKYSGADPELLGYPYPLPRTVSFGLNVGF